MRLFSPICAKHGAILLFLSTFQAFAGTPPDQLLTQWLTLALPNQSLPDEADVHPDRGLRVNLAGRTFEWRSADSATAIWISRSGPLPAPITAYAWTEFEKTEFENSSRTQAILEVASSAPVQIRLNGAVIQAGSALIPVDLRPGKNQLLLKTQSSAPWSFSCRLTSRSALVEKLVAESLNPGTIENIKPLLDSGLVDINARNEIGLTALQAARIRGRAGLAAFLLNRHADPNLPRPEPQLLLDAQLSRLVGHHRPGIAILVAKNGKVLFEKGYGMADVDARISVQPKTIFRIGSINKQFTAAAILKLQEQGKVSVTDKVSRYLPDYPRGSELTLAHLLSHTSGIHNYTEKAGFMDSVDRPVSLTGLVSMFRNDPLDFDPGTRWYYSNSNYVLLAYIIEKVTGRTYAEFLRRAILAPLGMHHTGVYGAKTARGYEYLDGAYIPAVDWDMSRAIGALAMYSTVEDLFRWNEALFREKVLNHASLSAAFTAAKTANRDVQSGGGYGYGFFLSTERGSPEIHHGGSLHGFSSFLLRLPREKMTVVVLANSLPSGPRIDTAGLARDAVEFFLGEQLGPSPVNQINPNIPSRALDAISGRYDYGPVIMTVAVESGHAYTQLAGQPRYEIFPKSETEFFWKSSDAQITFVKDPGGKIVKAIQYQDGYTIDAPHLAAMDASSIEAIVGRYDCSQFGTSILTISREGDRVFAQLTGQLSYELLPRSSTEFYWKGVNGDITFVKDAAGRATKAIQHRNGVKVEALRVE